MECTRCMDEGAPLVRHSISVYVKNSDALLTCTIQTLPSYLITSMCGLSGVVCKDEGSTTKSLILKPSYWRTGPRSQDVRECPDAKLGEGVSSCIGTLDEDGKRRDSGSLCRPGTEGPYCQVCSEPEHYMVDSECIDCKKGGEDRGKELRCAAGGWWRRTALATP